MKDCLVIRECLPRILAQARTGKILRVGDGGNIVDTTHIDIAAALKVDLPELFRFEQEATDKNAVEDRVCGIVKAMTEDDLRRLFMLLHVLYPAQ
jgi:hypothetical protein